MSTISAGPGSPPQSPLATARTVLAVVKEKEVTFLAASISYYTLVSLLPLLVLAVVGAVLLGGEALSAQITTAVQDSFPAGEGIVTDALENRSSQGGLGVVSLLLTVWGALKVFRGLDTAFSRIYGTGSRGLLDQVVDGISTLVSIVVGITGMILLTGALALLDVPLLALFAPLLLLATLFVAFLPLYYILPDVPLTLREVAPGTAVAAVGWAVLGVAFGIYADATGGSVAGALGALLLLVTWFYFSGILLLTGGVVNAVTSNRVASIAVTGESGDRQVQHPGGRRDGPTDMTGEGDRDADRSDDIEPRGAPDISDLERQVEELRADLDDFEADVDERTLPKADLEAELKRYIRGRMRRGKARGWGPYLVLLYGTVMTLGAFFFLDGLWAILAMVVLFLSTLGLYALFLIVGIGLNVLSVPGKAADAVRDRRD